MIDLPQGPGTRTDGIVLSMEADHSHAAEDIAARLAKAEATPYLKDAVYGAIDGAVTTFAIVAGVAGAGLPNGVIVALGCANILADGFSMAAGNYAGTKADVEDRDRLAMIEERQIAEHPEGEREELRQILEGRGLSGSVLDGAVAQIASSRRKWIEIMLSDEYGLPRSPPRPWRGALATFTAFLLAGTVPLAPFLFGIANPFDISLAATFAVFFAIGALKSRWSLIAWWRSGLNTLAIGAIAAGVAYFVGSLFGA